MQKSNSNTATMMTTRFFYKIKWEKDIMIKMIFQIRNGMQMYGSHYQTIDSSDKSRSIVQHVYRHAMPDIVNEGIFIRSFS